MEKQILGFLLLTICFACSYSLELPCSAKQPGEKCVYDEQCDGAHTVCSNQVCTCPISDFEDYHADNRTRVCRPAPRKVDAKCEKNCRPPLVCQNGQCVCWKAQLVGNQCVLNCPAGQILVGQICEAVSQTLGGSCTDDSDCLAPFTMCDKKQCVCLPGAKKTASGCVATCPDGSQPGAPCRLKYANDKSIRSNLEQMDTCSRGQRCVTYGKPSIGHCCKTYCPYGEPDSSKSCRRSDLLNKPNTACPESTTHYCQIIDSQGSRDRLCCPRPCREPTPFYWNNACWPSSHLDDPCSKDEQCEGGVAMQCSHGQCQCRDGFAKDNSGKFPTCTRSNCNPVTSVVVQNQCLPKVLVFGQQCSDNAQCPTNMRCADGACDCKCGFSYALGACYNPNDPLNVSPFFCNLQQIFQPGQKPDPKCVNLGGGSSGASASDTAVVSETSGR